MAEPDPHTPQVVDPERVVDLTRLLQIRGPLGVLNVLDTIVPVVNMGDVVTRTVSILQPSYRPTDIFSTGRQTAQPAGTILADTGALAEGIYDIVVGLNMFTIIAGPVINLEFRNAANTVSLAAWGYLTGTIIQGAPASIPVTFALDFAANERLRVVQVPLLAGQDAAIAVIFARRRT